MAKKATKRRGPGRPPSDDPSEHVVSFRLKGRAYRALAKYRARMGLATNERAARHLTCEGLVKAGDLDKLDAHAEIRIGGKS